MLLLLAIRRIRFAGFSAPYRMFRPAAFASLRRIPDGAEAAPRSQYLLGLLRLNLRPLGLTLRRCPARPCCSDGASLSAAVRTAADAGADTRAAAGARLPAGVRQRIRRKPPLPRRLQALVSTDEALSRSRPE
jgi:hypothetical protein